MPPGEKVGVVLHLSHQHLLALEPRLLGRNPVQRVGRALDEDHHLVVLVDAEEAGGHLAGMLIGIGREPRLVAGPTMDARVDVGKCIDRVAHSLERRCAGGVVEVDARDGAAAMDGDRQVDPGEVLAPSSGDLCGHLST